MKHLPLLAFILLVSCHSMAQVISNLQKELTISGAHYGFPGESLPDSDMVAVVMLVSDSTVHEYSSSTGPAFVSNNSCYYIKGFLKERKRADNYNESFWMVITAYLDADKKPLNKNTIVWQTKRLTP